MEPSKDVESVVATATELAKSEDKAAELKGAQDTPSTTAAEAPPPSDAPSVDSKAAPSDAPAVDSKAASSDAPAVDRKEAAPEAEAAPVKTAEEIRQETQRKLTLDRILFRQQELAKTTMMRAVVHRALVEAERWRRGEGLQQEGEVLSYYESWVAHYQASIDVNNRLLQFSRAIAAAAATFHASTSAAAEIVGPISSGQAMAQGSIGIASLSGGKEVATLNGSMASARAMLGGGLPEGAKAIESLNNNKEQQQQQMLRPAPSFFRVTRRGSADAGKPGSAAAATGGSGGAGGDGSAPHPAAASARNALGLSLVAEALQEVVGQASFHMSELASTVSRDVCGDVDGPLGAKGDGKHATWQELAEKSKGFREAIVPGPNSDPPSTLLALCGWYQQSVSQLRQQGENLVASLQEAFSLAVEAYGAFESLNTALLSGQTGKAVKGKDLWLLELRYRRCVRVSLAVRLRFMMALATLFERFRVIENRRTEIIANCVEQLSGAVAKLFDRVSAKAVIESLKDLTTHGDYFAVVAEDTRNRIASLKAIQQAQLQQQLKEKEEKAALERQQRRKSMRSGSVSGADGAAAGPADEGSDELHSGADGGSGSSSSSSGLASPPVTARTAARAAGDGYVQTNLGKSSSSSSSSRRDSTASSDEGMMKEREGGKRSLVSAFHFTLDPLPLVMTPLASPLVVRCGVLHRQTGGILKSWKPFMAVLTRDGFLHFFGADDPSVLDISRVATTSATTPAGGASAHPHSHQASSANFDEGNDLATHPELLHAIARYSAERLPSSFSTAHVGGGTSSSSSRGPAAATTGAAAAGGAGAGGGSVELPPPALPPHLMALASSFAGNVGDLLLAEEGEEEATEDGKARKKRPSTVGGGGAEGSGKKDGGRKSSNSAVSSSSVSMSEELEAVSRRSVGSAHLALERARKASAVPLHTFHLSNSTRLAAVPAVHADAFEITHDPSYSHSSNAALGGGVGGGIGSGSSSSGGESAGFFSSLFSGGVTKLLLRATNPGDAVDWLVAIESVLNLLSLGTAAAATGGEP